MEILKVGPNWLVIWLVTWSLSHSRLEAIVAAISLGLVLDALTSAYPTHLLGLVAVAWLTSQDKNHHSSYNIILVMLRVFVLVLLVEGIMAIQYLWLNFSFLDEVWLSYQRIGISSALLSSLWTPFLYYPLHKWWSSPKRRNLPRF